MPDFSEVRGVTIPEGNVAVIRHGSQTLWQRLPTGYREIAWIGFGTGGVISTGITPSYDNCVLSMCIAAEAKKTGNNYITWTGATASNPRFNFLVNSGVLSMYANSSTGAASSVGSFGTMSAVFNSVGMRIVNRQVTKSFNGSSVGTASINAGAAAPNHVLKLYDEGEIGFSCKSFAYSDGVQECSLVPCRRESDGEVGMFDIINGVFLMNQGTGDLIAGPDL